MTRILVTLLVIALVFIGIGCNKSADNDPNINLLIDDEFNVNLWEDLHPDSRHLRFNLTTIENQNCLNTNIDYSLQRLGDGIILSINDLMDPNDCLTGMAPANASVLIGSLENGSYPLQVNLKNEIVNNGTLKVTYTQYSIELDTKHGILLQDEELKRVPEQTIWGFIGYKDAALNTVDGLSDEIATLTEPKLLSEGNYGHFSINSNVEIELNEQSEFNNMRTIVLHLNDENKESLGNVLSDYRDNYSGEMEIKIYTDKGEEL